MPFQLQAEAKSAKTMDLPLCRNSEIKLKQAQ